MQHGPKRFVYRAALLVFTAHEGDTFGLFPETSEHITVFRLGLVFALRHGDEAVPDEHHGSAGEHRIDHGGDHEKARDCNGGASYVERESSPDCP